MLPEALLPLQCHASVCLATPDAANEVLQLRVRWRVAEGCDQLCAQVLISHFTITLSARG
jgi:hypothetical protein